MDIRKNIYFRDVEGGGRLYQRVVAGIGWSSDRPAGCVLIGEETSYGPKYDHFLLAEIEEFDTGLFFKRCADLQKRYNIMEFVGRLDKANIRYLSEWNSARRVRNTATLEIDAAPFSEDGYIGYHISIVKDKLRSNQKTLHFTEGSKLPGYLLEIQAGETSSIKDTKIPLVSALCYAVTAMTEWPFEPSQAHTTSETNYDVFNHKF